jgi:hypothetical protein
MADEVVVVVVVVAVTDPDIFYVFAVVYCTISVIYRAGNYLARSLSVYLLFVRRNKVS